MGRQETAAGVGARPACAADVNDLLDRRTHFDFGENWAAFASHIDDARVARAEQDLRRLLPDGLDGLRVLDIGCGSGLSAVAALRIGAAAVDCCDIDEQSVATASAVLTRIAGGNRWTVRRASVFDLDPARAGVYDVVYSWGVLHHTGDMARAIRSAAACVAPGGRFVIAIYAKTPACKWWAIEKRLYSRSPRPVQIAAQWAYAVISGTLKLAIFGQNPFRAIRNYHEARGMRFWNDVHDWLGGYPYESATPEEVDALVGDGFVRERAFLVRSRTGVFGSGCNEYVFRRRSADAR